MADRFMHQSLAFYGADGSLESDFQFVGAHADAVLRGARQGDDQFRSLPVPAEFWGDIDQTLSLSALLPELFSKRWGRISLSMPSLLTGLSHRISMMASKRKR
jgi:hypothetical protein